VTDAIVVVTDDQSILDRRYPGAVQHGGQTIPVAHGSIAGLTGPGVVGGIVDIGEAGDEAAADDVCAALKSGVPLLLTAGSMAVLRAADDVPADLWLHGGWAPYLPLRRAVDVVAAAQLVADGAIGPPVHCEVTTWVDTPGAAGWENDAPFARSEHEARLFGLDLAERLLGRELPTTAWARRTSEGPGGLAVQEGAGVAASLAVLPVALAAVPSFSAVVTGEEGRLLLRQPFAPGALTVWDAASRAFRCPALRRPKANVQAPDSARGGRETVEELEALLSGPVSDDVRRSARRLTDQALATAQASATTTTEGEPS